MLQSGSAEAISFASCLAFLSLLTYCLFIFVVVGVAKLDCGRCSRFSSGNAARCWARPQKMIYASKHIQILYTDHFINYCGAFELTSHVSQTVWPDLWRQFLQLFCILSLANDADLNLLLMIWANLLLGSSEGSLHCEEKAHLNV